ncbi:PepSY domain-containing protein [Sphingomonas oligophenolica]|uniref:PepSY domain-containing protein n=1 Tax=Sphingomonas oligophenolica TaxID=301154 RepID=A0ABU9XWS0_9SPHN
MKHSAPFKILFATAALSIASLAAAGPVCTRLPQAKWLTPAQMKAKIATMGYRDIKVFQVSGSCYEIYAHTKDGKRAEVYFNPVTGAVVQNNID